MNSKCERKGPMGMPSNLHSIYSNMHEIYLFKVSKLPVQQKDTNKNFILRIPEKIQI